ncbi:MAG: GPW/gp25 family protein [Acetobacteraceae bacterium]
MTGPIATTAKPDLPSVAIGWPLLPVPDADGRLTWPDAPASVRQMIEVILRTAPGEQLMRPEFGAGLEAVIHEPNTLTTRARVHDAITDALRRFEKRIILDRVDVDPAPDPRELLITLSYRLTLTGAPARIQARVPVGAG